MDIDDKTHSTFLGALQSAIIKPQVTKGKHRMKQTFTIDSEAGHWLVRGESFRFYITEVPTDRGPRYITEED